MCHTRIILGNNIDFTMLFIQHADLRVGFEDTTYSVAESAGVLEIPVRLFDNGTTPRIGLPLGVRVTSRDGSAVGM